MQQEPPLSRIEIRNLRAEGLGPLSLDLADGECVCLSGPSGSGKTRFLRAIADLDPHAGEVALDAVPRARFRAPEWRRRVGLLPAENHWWLERVGDHFRDLGQDQLDALGLERDLLAHPVARLSSGERQRFALLRLLANQPRALLLDEPTANLDARSAARVEAVLERYRRRHRAGMLWVSHDPEQIRRLGARHLRLRQGRLDEESMARA